MATIGLTSFARGGAETTPELAVIGSVDLTSIEAADPELIIETHLPAEELELRQAVERGEIDGLLVLDADGAGTLTVAHAPPWRGRLEAWLTSMRTRARLAERGLSSEDLARIIEPVELRVTELSPPRAGRGARIAALIAVGVMMFAVFNGVAYVFASITGEKQSRVTEQLLACVPPQSWIDGKILGLSLVTFASVLNTMLSGLVVLLFWRALGHSLPLPGSLGDPLTVVVVLLFALLGFAFWFTFMAAIAATIDDPNTSTRSSLLLLPLVATGAGAFSGLQPETQVGYLLALLPPTSAAAMPARLMVVDVAAWQIALAMLLLVAASFALRSIAGRIFALGVLMYGKEPSWAEMRRWMRET
jgi:ABC-2 type transport system permease protein